MVQHSWVSISIAISKQPIFSDYMESARRKWLGHEVPSWVPTNEHLFFITVCCRERGAHTLDNEKVGNSLLETVQTRTLRRIWYPLVFMIMPDHVHFVLRMGSDSKGLKQEIANWKSWTSKTLGVKWQPGFFDHRIRNDESLNQKIEYVLENPVRANLVDRVDNWPWKSVSDIR